MAVATKERLTRPSREFEQMLIENMDMMYISALKLTKNHADARDLQQDAIVRALRFHHKFEQGTYIKAWLHTIVRNTFINDYRKKRRRPATVEWSGAEDYVPAFVEPDSDMAYFTPKQRREDVLEYLSDEVRKAVDSLPDGHRSTLIMADLQDMSYREIAEELDCPVGTVMSRLHRGRRLMRNALENHMPMPAFG